MKRKSMKRTAVLLLGTFLLLTGCDTAATDNSAVLLSDEYDDFIIYDINDQPDEFTVGDDGTMYIYTNTYGESGEITNIRLNSYDMNGNHTQLGEYGKSAVCVDRADDLLYCVIVDMDHYSVCSVDTENQSTNEVCRLEGYSNIKSIDVNGNEAYILGINKERTQMSGEYTDESGNYSYGGEQLIKVDLSTGETTISEVPFPIAVCVYNGECVVYAADKDGYYFTDFSDKSKKYHNIEMLFDFEMYEQDKFLFYSGSGINIGKLCAGTTNPDDGISQVLDGYLSFDDIHSVGGYTYFEAIDADGTKICRLKNSAYIKKNNKIRLISAEHSFDEPFGCGYTIDYQNLPSDSFALTVLSQDSNYDMSIVNSYDSFSSGIRDKGSFYPLNDIPYVQEYIDKCFPYIKNAATDENGDIWMLPVSVNIPMIVYNKTNCAEAGIDFTDKMTIEEFIKVCETAFNSKYKNGYDVHPYRFTQNLLIQYMASHEKFDTDIFRSFAQFAKEKICISDFSEFPQYLPISNEAMNHMYEAEGEEQFLFSCQWDNSMALWQSESENFRFSSVPSIDSDSKNQATCAFLTINPASKNLEATLDYVSSLAKYLSESQNSFMLSDKSAYTMTEGIESLYRLYEDAEIGFNVSDEICFDSYKEYHKGNLSLDQFIAEADRKLSAYRNE